MVVKANVERAWNLHDLNVSRIFEGKLERRGVDLPRELARNSADFTVLAGDFRAPLLGQSQHVHERGTDDGADDALDWFVEQIIAECHAKGALILWHENQSEPQIIRSVKANEKLGAEHAMFLEHALAAMRDAPQAYCRDIGVQKIDDLASISSLIRLNDGLVSITMHMRTDGRNEVLACRAALSRWLPLSKAFFAQWVAMKKLLVQKNALTSAINHTDIPTMLLGQGGVLRYVNNSAELLLAKNKVIRRMEGRLICSSLADTLQLQSAIAHLLENNSIISPILTFKHCAQRPILLALVSSRPSQHKKFGEDLAIAYVYDPEQDQAHLIEVACELYGLSPCEARLASALIDGLSLSEAAKKLRLRENTARSYLKQIFIKTETNRQGELVQLLLRSSIRMSASDQPTFV